MPGEKHNFWVAGYYGNMLNWSSSGWQSPLHVGSKWNETRKEQEVMSLADAFTRELYLSNDINTMYIGFEATESFRSFPFDDSTSLIYWKGKCLRDVPMSEWNLPHLEHVGEREGYTPLCRGWYEKAKRANGKIVYNGVDTSASTGALYLSISVALKNARGNIFGVAAIDTSIDELSKILSEKILNSGYLYLSDNVMGLVVHPQSQSEMSTILKVEFNCEGGANSNEMKWFEEKWDSSIKVTKSGIVEHTKCGKEHLLAWNRVEKTDYILFLSVPLSDVSATADAAIKAVMMAIEIVVGLCVGLAYPAVLGFLFVVAFSMSKLLKKLVKVINQIANTPEADITLPKAGFFDVAELISIIKNVTRLLAALRFGNVNWTKGDLDLEISNCRYLEVVMREVNNLSGHGVVLNNKGNALRKLSRRRKDQQITLLKQACSCFMQAIEISKKVGGEETRQASRFVGAGLTLMDIIVTKKNLENFEEAMNMFSSARKLYLNQESWKGLANMGFLITTHEGSSTFHNNFFGLIEAVSADCTETLKSYLKFSKELKQQDFDSICRFCYTA